MPSFYLIGCFVFALNKNIYIFVFSVKDLPSAASLYLRKLCLYPVYLHVLRYTQNKKTTTFPTLDLGKII